MPMRDRQLAVWMNGERVGTWEQAATERFSYSPAWINSASGRPLSLSLPFRPGNLPYQGELVSAFFDNLLPDSDAIRRRLALRYRANDTTPFTLLSTLGRDCVGALQLLPPGETPDVFSITGEPLNEAAIAQILRQASGGALGQQNAAADLRLSIAGAQEKTALLRNGDAWLLPTGSTPTTHIFKLPMGLVGNMQADMQTSVENEWLCARLAQAVGLPVAQCEIARFEDQKVLIVERFDRRLANDDRWIIRLPQEDMCQATGTPPLRKYQADGGPGMADIISILRGSDAAADDVRLFFKAQLFFWLLAATDGHAKNFSVAHLPGGHYRMTPLYDILSAHPIIGTGRNQLPPTKAKLAMAVRASSGNTYLLGKIQRRHWNAEARTQGIGRDAEELIEELLTAVPQAMDQVCNDLPEDVPQGLAESICKGMQKQAEKLAAMPAKKP